MITEVFFDVETKTFFDETGVKDPSALGVSLVSVYRRILDNNLEEKEGQMLSFWENELNRMWPLFSDAKRVIGYNSKKFDVPALKPYAPDFFSRLPHFDLVDEIKKIYGKRVRLDVVAKDTLGIGKSDSGANAVLYFRRGDKESLEKLRRYCEDDVKLTRDIYHFGLTNKFLKFTDHWNTPRQIEVDFSYPADQKEVDQIGLF